MDRRRPHKLPARPLVLVVDGHDDAQEPYALALPAFGLEAMRVEIAAAYRRAWETHPDIIVIDASLRQSDAWELLRQLKADPRTRDVPVVVLASQGETSVRERAEREGCAVCLIKPCLPKHLAVELRAVLIRGVINRPTSV